MSERFIPPKTSPEIAKQVFQEYSADPRQFIKHIASILGEANPSFLDGQLGGAVTISLIEHPFSARQILAGSFFRYECTARQLALTGDYIPSIGIATNIKTLAEIERITISAQVASSDMDTVTRLRATRIERDDPAIGSVIHPLLEKSKVARRRENVEAFIEGAHGTHLKFLFIDPADSEKAVITSEVQPSIIPPVRRSIVRTALLESILDPKFVITSLDRIKNNYPRMVEAINRIKGRPEADIYRLLAGFTTYCIMEEFSQRGLTLPTVEETPTKHPDPKVQEAMDRRSPNESLLMREYSMRVLQEVEDTNPDLNWGVSRLFDPLSQLSGDSLIAGLYGFVHQYSTIKTGLS